MRLIPLMPRAYAISSQARIGICDCLYIALAEREQCSIVSEDARLAGQFPLQVVSLATFFP